MILNRFKSNWKIKVHFDWLNLYAAKKSYPICIEIDPSNSCPLSCGYCCWAAMRNQTSAAIPEERLLRLVSEAKDLGIKSIIWTGGGDPLTNPATIKAIQLSKHLGIHNGMFTNGVLMTESVADTLSENLNWIRFHVGGSNPEYYSKNHGVKKEIFDLVCRNIKYIASKKTNDCGIGVAINKDNFEGIKELPQLAMKLGVEYFQAKLDFGQIGSDDYVQWWFSQVVPHFEKLENELKGKVKIHVFNDPIVRKTEVGYCHAHHVITAITADGRVAFCKMRRDQQATSIGNIFDNSLKEILDSEKHVDIASHICPNTCPILASFCPYRTTNETIDELIELKKSYDVDHLNFF